MGDQCFRPTRSTHSRKNLPLERAGMAGTGFTEFCAQRTLLENAVIVQRVLGTLNLWWNHTQDYSLESEAHLNDRKGTPRCLPTLESWKEPISFFSIL